jgi:adenosylcobinamide-phosphate synthase
LLTLPTAWLELLQQPWLQLPLLALLIILLSTFMPLPPSYQPLQLFRLMAAAMANKVNKTADGVGQQLLSGSLALLLLLLPIWALVSAFAELSEWPEFWHALLLYCCLDWQQQRQQALAISQSLDKQQLNLARDQLQPLVLRQTRQMSSVGISKACIESLSLRFSKQWFSVLFWFMVGGGIAALMYRLLQELQQSWNPKLSTFRHFGRPVALLVSAFSFVPVFLCGTLLALLRNWRQSTEYFSQSQDGNFGMAQRWLLSASSAALSRNLAGPLYYDAVKHRRVRIGPVTEPQSSDIRIWLNLCRQLQIASFVLIASCWLLLLVGTW